VAQLKIESTNAPNKQNAAQYPIPWMPYATQ